MRLKRLSTVIAGLLLAGSFGVTMPSEASSTGVIAGSCDAATIKVDGGRLTTPNGGFCVVTEYVGPNIVANAVQTASIEITAPDVEVQCSGSAVRGFSGAVTVAVHGNSTDSFPDVVMIVDGASGPQTLNPTATALIKGRSFAGAGTFTRQGSGSCASGSATWTLGHVAFEDPTL